MNSTLIKQNFELRNENQKLKNEVKRLSNALSIANNNIKQLEKKIENYKKNEEKHIEEAVKKAVNKVIETITKEHQDEVNKLNAKIKRLESRLNTDSTNSGTPTSKQSIGKHVIQNNREHSEKSKGSQLGHKQHKLEYFKDDEITNTVEHTLEKCPKCGGQLIENGIVKSDIIDIDIKVIRTRNNIHNYKCSHCKSKVTANSILPRGVSYGDNINSIGLSLMNEANTPLNKITSFFQGITNNEINLCEGYLIKLQKRNANKLNQFVSDLKEKIISLSNIYWDDTVVAFGTEKSEEGYDEDDISYLEEKKQEEKEVKVRNGIIRFYGDDKWALLIGHRHKNADSIDDDGILDNLTENCTVMHDHVLLNYNDKYSFKNAECNEHTKRYLKNNMDMFPTHTWAGKMRELLINTNNEKKELQSKNIFCFDNDKLKEISNLYDEYIELGYKENATVDLTFIQDKIDEFNLVDRLNKFKENHLMFATDFSVNFTNNTSERGLRQTKRKLAVSFMFKNANRMKDYATILSYLETCYRHGISRYDASKRLSQGNPYTIKELESIVSNSI